MIIFLLLILGWFHRNILFSRVIIGLNWAEVMKDIAKHYNCYCEIPFFLHAWENAHKCICFIMFKKIAVLHVCLKRRSWTWRAACVHMWIWIHFQHIRINFTTYLAHIEASEDSFNKSQILQPTKMVLYATFSITPVRDCIRTIRHEWCLKSPLQKWCYVYCIGKMAGKLIQIPTCDENQSLFFYSYFGYGYYISCAFLVLYTIDLKEYDVDIN